MKIKDLKKQSDKKLISMKKELEESLIRTKSDWSSKEEKNIKSKGITGKGENTKQTLQIRRMIAQINTTLNQRGLSSEACKNKPRSKRRERRLRGRAKG